MKYKWKHLTFQLDEDANISTLIQNSLTTKQLVKTAAIVTPLIYKKTPYGFFEDLQEFFAKNNLYLSNSVLVYREKNLNFLNRYF